MGDLGRLIAKVNARGEFFTEEFVIAVLLDLVNGLAMLHQNRICHRDLKPPNVFISKEGTFKVSSHSTIPFTPLQVIRRLSSPSPKK
jgi:serine/threonine protein kinase